MKNVSPYNFVWIFWVLVGLFSCKEERVFPEVNILSVGEGTTFDYGDTIQLRVRVDKADEGVLSDILKGDQTTGLPSEIIDREGNEFLIFFYHTDKYLETGTYSIRISAFNGDNRGSDFRQIQLNEFPLRYRGVALLSGEGNQRVLARVDSIGQTITLALSGDFNYVACNGAFDQVLAAPERSGKLAAFGFKSLNLEYELPNPKPEGTQQYRNLHTFQRKTYAFLDDGRARALNRGGGFESQFTLQDPYVVHFADYIAEDEMVVAAKERTANNWRIFIVNPASGFIKKQTFVKPGVVGISYDGNGNTYITYPVNNESVVARYSHQSGLVTELYMASDETPRDILVRNGVGFLATDQGLYNFATTGGSPLQQRFDFGVDNLVYEAQQAEVYFTAGNVVYKTGLSSGVNRYVAAASEQVMDLAIMYNK